MNKLKVKIYRLVNRQLNKRTIKNKVFCIKLHKTGTTTLANLARQYGFYASHSTDWMTNSEMLNKYDFFSDGGSHFDNIREFNFQTLFYNHPESKFILQTRDTEKWIISKLTHAGWNENTIIEDDDINKIKHDHWRYKSLLTIRKFIEHKINYEERVLKFFNENGPHRLLIIDITNAETQKNDFGKFTKYLNLRSINKIEIPHLNKHSTKINLPDKAVNHIEQVIAAHNNKMRKLQGIFQEQI